MKNNVFSRPRIAVADNLKFDTIFKQDEYTGIVEETDKDPKMVGAMLAVDGETDRKHFNTREKILAFLDSKGLDIDGKIKAMQSAQGADKTFYTNVKTKKQQLESEIAMYLTYAWVEYK